MATGLLESPLMQPSTDSDGRMHESYLNRLRQVQELIRDLRGQIISEDNPALEARKLTNTEMMELIRSITDSLSNLKKQHKGEREQGDIGQLLFMANEILEIWDHIVKLSKEAKGVDASLGSKESAMEVETPVRSCFFNEDPSVLLDTVKFLIQHLESKIESVIHGEEKPKDDADKHRLVPFGLTTKEYASSLGHATSATVTVMVCLPVWALKEGSNVILKIAPVGVKARYLEWAGIKPYARKHLLGEPHPVVARLTSLISRPSSRRGCATR